MRLIALALLFGIPLFGQSIPGWRSDPEDPKLSRLAILPSEDTAAGRGVALHIGARTDRPSTGSYYLSLRQHIKADVFRGKRIRFSGELRSAGEVTANLWLRIDGPPRILDLANDGSSGAARRGSVEGNSDWKKVEQVVDVPPEALGIAIGVAVTGFGDAWVNSLKLEVVDGSSVAVTGFGLGKIGERQKEFPAAERERATAGLTRFYQSAPTAPANLDFQQRIP